MMDHDQIQRALADLEKRVARLERAGERPSVDVIGDHVYRTTIARIAREDSQFCMCGRETCRAPDCPSFKKERA